MEYEWREIIKDVDVWSFSELTSLLVDEYLKHKIKPDYIYVAEDFKKFSRELVGMIDEELLDTVGISYTLDISAEDVTVGTMFAIIGNLIEQGEIKPEDLTKNPKDVLMTIIKRGVPEELRGRARNIFFRETAINGKDLLEYLEYRRG